MKTPAAIVAASLGLLVLHASAFAGVRVLESDSRHVILEITPPEPVVETVATDGGRYVRLSLPEFGTTGEVGRPEIPMRGERVAVPPGHEARLRVLEERWSSSIPGALYPVPETIALRDEFGVGRVVERTGIESEVYASTALYPERRFRLSDPAAVRHQRVVSVIYHAAQSEVLARSYRLLERAVVEVVFESIRSGPQRVGALLEPAGDEGLTRGEALNAGDAASWARQGPGDATTTGDSPWGGGEQWKVEIEATGIVELTYTDLASAGFPAGVPVEQVSLYQRSFDLDHVDDTDVAASELFVPLAVPSVMRDRNDDGTFNASDGVLFYARSFRDQFMTSGYEHEDRFDTANFVWVRVDPEGGARMETVRAAGSLSGDPADLLDSTPSKVFRENDVRYYDHPPDHASGRDAFETEIYYWNDARTPTGGANGWVTDDPFTTPDPVPGRPATLTTRIAPGGTVNRNYTNVIELSINEELVGTSQFYNFSLYVGDIVPPENTLNSYEIPAGVLDGENTFGLHGWTYTGNATNTVFYFTRFFLDWYEITYDRELRAFADALELSTANGQPNNVLAQVQDFGGSDLRLFDVTDPANPAVVGVAPAQVIAAGGGSYDLHFDHDNSSGEATFVAIRESSIPTVDAGRITNVAPPTLLAGGAGARWLAIAHDEFLSGAMELAEYRSQHHTSLAVALSEVYNVFNNGAIHPVAVKGFATYAFHRWSDPILFLCLIGDHSEDHRGLLPNSDPDYLPSHSLWAAYEGAFEESDQYYAELTRGLPGGPFDDIADIHVGRLPVGSAWELDTNVKRIREYENREVFADWRRNVAFLADDQFSGSLGGGFGVPYGWQFAEGAFESVSGEMTDSLNARPFYDLAPEVLNMSAWSHPCPDSCYNSHCDDCENELGEDCGNWYDCRVVQANCFLGSGDWIQEYVCMREAMWQAVLPLLRDKTESGIGLLNYQGHANRFFMAHEEVFKDYSSRHDVETLTNYGRPFILVGFACHLAEGDKYDEANSTTGDCLAEKMMMVGALPGEPQRGAVAAFASSGFEFLTPNLTFNRQFFDAWYPASGKRPRFLGQATTRSRRMYQDTFFSGNTRQAAQRFMLLGDPSLRISRPLLEVAANGDALNDGGTIVTRHLNRPIRFLIDLESGIDVREIRIDEPVPYQILPGEAEESSGPLPMQGIAAQAVLAVGWHVLELDLVEDGVASTESMRFRVVTPKGFDDTPSVVAEH